MFGCLYERVLYGGSLWFSNRLYFMFKSTSHLLIYSENPLNRQGLSHDNMLDKRECWNIESLPLYVTKIIRNIHWFCFLLFGENPQAVA